MNFLKKSVSFYILSVCQIVVADAPNLIAYKPITVGNIGKLVDGYYPITNEYEYTQILKKANKGEDKVDFAKDEVLLISRGYVPTGGCRISVQKVELTYENGVNGLRITCNIIDPPKSESVIQAVSYPSTAIRIPVIEGGYKSYIFFDQAGRRLYYHRMSDEDINSIINIFKYT